MTSAWFPDGARAAVSITFDDARASQIDVGEAILSAHGVHGTFYVLPWAVRQRVDDWKRLAAAGHEIGNHTRTHPCSANHHSAGDNALEEYSVRRIARDIAGGSTDIVSLLGVEPRTFAYPCGQTHVGRGKHKASYVPVIARRFVAGRGYRSETTNDPARCDPALLDAFHADNMDVDELVGLVHDAVEQERWAVFVCHEVGDAGPLGIGADALDGFCRELERDDRIWVAPVVEVAERIRRRATP
jgi:peptidoglycan/xylan/chitin deacetylase (PgdA/CDA1 family)